MVHTTGGRAGGGGCVEGHEFEVSESERRDEGGVGASASATRKGASWWRAGRPRPAAADWTFRLPPSASLGASATGQAHEAPVAPPSLQYHGQHLVIGLNRDGQRFPLIESFFRDLKTDNDGSSLFGAG